MQYVSESQADDVAPGVLFGSDKRRDVELPNELPNKPGIG